MRKPRHKTSDRDRRATSYQPKGQANRTALAARLRESTDDVDFVSDRPKTRADCVDGPRPCPWASCRHHNAVEVSRRGTLTIVSEGEPPVTCSLDGAEQGGMTLDEIGVIFCISRERVRQIEVMAMDEIRQSMEALSMFALATALGELRDRRLTTDESPGKVGTLAAK